MIICTFEDKGTAKLRHVTVNALVLKESKVLLAKRGTYNNGKPLEEAGKWSLLGGFMSRDETIEQALRREVKEESGWEITNLRLLHIKDNPDRCAEDRQNVEFVYLVDAAAKVSGSDEEVRELKWFSLAEIPSQEEMAFDHRDDLLIYNIFLKGGLFLPVMVKYSY